MVQARFEASLHLRLFLVRDSSIVSKQALEEFTFNEHVQCTLLLRELSQLRCPRPDLQYTLHSTVKVQQEGIVGVDLMGTCSLVALCLLEDSLVIRLGQMLVAYAVTVWLTLICGITVSNK
jgi:hypothetical protein